MLVFFSFLCLFTIFYHDRRIFSIIIDCFSQQISSLLVHFFKKEPALRRCQKAANRMPALYFKKFLNLPFYFSITVEMLFPGSIRWAVFPSTRN